MPVISAARCRDRLPLKRPLLVVVLGGVLVSVSAVSNEAAPTTKAWAAGLKDLTPSKGRRF